MIPEGTDPEVVPGRVKVEETRARRGRLTVFFGAAAGVGKTYAMLQAARAQRDDGVDVVVGYVETHGRAETERLLDGLEMLPTRRVPYGGAVLRELDLDAALDRRPSLVLVDQLAHTNAAGSRHAKRWQDVIELLEAGIGVYTTLDVQHLESLNDVVAQITGVVVGETVPDLVLEQADEIALVDLPPDGLLERLSEGKVHVPAQAAGAIEQFFRKGNLIALRELALRRTAQRVDAQMRTYMREHAIPAVWPVAERVMVCVGPSPHSAQLVRRAKRMAEQLDAQWLAAYVETPAHARLSEEARAQVGDALRLAEQLGAETITLTGQRMSDELLAFARRRNVTRLLVGKPRRRRWQRIVMGSIVDTLVEGSGEIEVQVSGGERAAEAAPTPWARPSPAVDWRGHAVAAVAVTAATAVAGVIAPIGELSNVVMLYLMAIVAVAMRHGRGPSVAASLLSVAALDFFFVPPHLTFAVSDMRFALTFAVMLAVGLLIGTLTVRIRAQAETARQRELRTAALYAMSRELASTRGVSELVAVVVRHLREVFRCDVLVLLPDGEGGLVAQAVAGELTLEPSEMDVARWVYEHRQRAGLGTTTLPGARALYQPLIAPRGPVGVLGLRPADPGELRSPEQQHHLETFANQAALAIDRTRLADEARAAAIREETERLRSSLLSSVSHDLRTPLASITGAVSTVLENDPALAAGERRELLESARAEAGRLNRLVENLLEITRLQSGAVELRREWNAMEEVVGSALTRMRGRMADRHLDVRVPADLPLIEMDAVLVEQVLINLLDNALKYTPPGSPITIRVTSSDRAVTVEMADRGPGLPPGREEKVFEKFYRGEPEAGRGAGLGLTICKAIVDAHGGLMWAHNLPEGGVAVFFTLPRAAGRPHA